MATLQVNLENRKWLLEKLRAEIVGPDPAGAELMIPRDGKISLTTEQAFAPKKQANGEEIIWQDPPIKRYGAGVLFPQEITDEKQLAAESCDADGAESQDESENSGMEKLEDKIEKHARTKVEADDSEDYDVSLANSYRPSAMGVSFLADMEFAGTKIVVEIEAAQYLPTDVMVGKEKGPEGVYSKQIWLRRVIATAEGNKPEIAFDTEKILVASKPLRFPVPGQEEGLQIVLFSRNLEASGSKKRLITISLVNINRTTSMINEKAYFQCGFKVKAGEEAWILPYPEADCGALKHEDEKISRILYRDRKTFAIGHGCSADWSGGRNSIVQSVWTESMPCFETPSISADFRDENGKPVRVSMRKLAGLDAGDDGWDEVDKLVNAYEKWIGDLRQFDKRNPPVPPGLYDTAKVLVDRCEECLGRIREGIKFLKSDEDIARKALSSFRLANHAMLVAQLRASRSVREPVDEKGQLRWNSGIHNPDPSVADKDKGYWRPFQIAFVLMSIPGICSHQHKDREVVDLIWFPTGGGKTEAYLGLTAITIFFNRIAKRDPAGADVLMRYTLRLLTAQQFQRATLLFCAMEFLRKTPQFKGLLGEKRFTLGMYVGGDSTPNTRSEAKKALNSLRRNPDNENPFVLLKCPWCNARMGPLKEPIGKIKVLGYREESLGEGLDDTVVYRCPDTRCDFGTHPLTPKDPLPVLLIDEDIFDQPPNLVIGTVDKFAMLAWKPQARAIFGIDKSGKHTGIPPTLIIQDELHLISGPLGSMVGAYETVFETLCSSDAIRPKIVASTATISRANEQVRALYARDRMMLFPPSGLEAGDSFFAREALDKEGKPAPGRLYAGVMAPAHGSLLTTQSRIYAALLQFAAMIKIPDKDKSVRDPWWTLLVFFNSLRELGGAATLLVSDARDYLRVILTRHGISYDQIRQLLSVEELTSRIRNDRIPEAIQKLEIPYDTDENGYLKGTVEVCLASNIIEVGVDIDRLSLMTIVGQPKTTAQYIQVSSRVGRNKDAPGLVVVAYSQSKPRDRSHYERFRSYHERLYSQVEPTSVTPFSPPVVERALHALMVAIARQTMPLDESQSPRPFPLPAASELHDRVRKLILDRVAFIDGREMINAEKILEKRLSEWRCWDPSSYGGFGLPPEDPPLMFPAGSFERPEWYGKSWSTPSSMRNVDADCEAEVTRAYNETEGV